MTNNTKIILGLVLILLIGIVVSASMTKTPPVEIEEEKPVVQVEDVRGCYVATLAKDVYTLNIQNQVGAEVGGRMVFKNFEKDSSSGDVSGKYEDGILFGRYKFQSEGMTSDMEVVFMRQGNDFIRGYGDVDSTGEKFVDLNKITYDTKVVFKATTGTCATAL